MTSEILEKIGNYKKLFDKARILKAFDFVGEKYSALESKQTCHLHVLEILLPLKPDEDTIVAILLHDLFVMSVISEDTVADNFGPQVLEILNSLRKIYGLKYAEMTRNSGRGFA
jgi:(p)ppGpp synthase/HD superfamily hydrolase